MFLLPGQTERERVNRRRRERRLVVERTTCDGTRGSPPGFSAQLALQVSGRSSVSLSLAARLDRRSGTLMHKGRTRERTAASLLCSTARTVDRLDESTRRRRSPSSNSQRTLSPSPRLLPYSLVSTRFLSPLSAQSVHLNINLNVTSQSTKLVAL